MPESQPPPPIRRTNQLKPQLSRLLLHPKSRVSPLTRVASPHPKRWLLRWQRRSFQRHLPRRSPQPRAHRSPPMPNPSQRKSSPKSSHKLKRMSRSRKIKKMRKMLWLAPVKVLRPARLLRSARSGKRTRIRCLIAQRLSRKKRNRIKAPARAKVANMDQLRSQSWPRS